MNTTLPSPCIKCFFVVVVVVVVFCFLVLAFFETVSPYITLTALELAV